MLLIKQLLEHKTKSSRLLPLVGKSVHFSAPSLNVSVRNFRDIVDLAVKSAQEISGRLKIT